jgi:hypothetical protein
MTFNADIFDKHHNLSKPTDLWFPGKGLLCSFMFTYRIYGHSRFCNTDFEDIVGLHESIRRLNRLYARAPDEFRA